MCGGLRSFVAFLAEQPKQLKHLEWPGFRNTLRTATLTLILVAAFIVVLSSVDAALCYILSWLLQKSALSYREYLLIAGDLIDWLGFGKDKSTTAAEIQAYLWIVHWLTLQFMKD
ncbi:hypothetical protein ABZP36_033441 [Zizania latifolia]